MGNNFNTKYYETFAAMTLINAGYILETFSESWLADKPDLQIGNLGVEVVTAISSFDGEQRNYEQQLLQCKTFDEAVALSKTDYFQRSKWKIKQVLDKPAFFLMSGVKDYDKDETENTVVDKISEKSRKFSHYPDYVSFSKKGVFIHAASDPFTTVFEMADFDIEVIREEINSSIFDVAFILLPTKLVILEKGTVSLRECVWDKFDVHEITLETMRVLNFPDYDEKKSIISKMKEEKTS